MNFVLPFLISLLMGMGIGGGGLFIVYLTTILSLPQTTAQGTNLIFFIISAISALIIHIRKRKFYPVQAITMIIFGILGSYIFSHLTNMIDPDIPRAFLGCVLILGGGVSIFSAIKSFFKRQ
ncbi:MAG: sulfite exporter TauE/SafE family protein [Ruminococcaceae bacterium]|nr:sulfite exporter TauE/SafE family protein [Oscillospiraceae bacterium]